MAFWKKNNSDSTPPQLPDSFRLVGSGSAFKKNVREMIAGSWLFGSLDAKNINFLADYTHCYEVDAGTVIFREGEVGNYLCLLITGQVEIFKEDQIGNKHHLAFIRTGNTFGEMALIDNEPRSATCVSTSDSVLLILTRQSYMQIIIDQPTLAINILIKLARLMSQRLRNLSGQVVEHL